MEQDWLWLIWIGSNPHFLQDNTKSEANYLTKFPFPKNGYHDPETKERSHDQALSGLPRVQLVLLESVSAYKR